ncbi:MAG: XRE family transcriptional regulator [Bacteroidia bacterium]|nr:XRE family transcriptional regulator [Bacteroidia bacterium]
MNKQNVRLIFGLKLKQLRIQKGLSFAELSKAANVSVSYLNEIEKGKKYPKADKIIALASALGVSYDQLVSLKLNKKLAPVADLINSGILESLPLEMFGLEASTLLELISGAPVQFNAFISTLLKIARNYEMTRENFFLAALRSYQEMHDNYFEDLEQAVDTFVARHPEAAGLPVSREALLAILCDTYQYQINWDTLDQDELLRRFRSVYVDSKRTLYINNALSHMQQAFLLGKEIAYNYLELKERPATSNLDQVSSFEEVLNNFKASYFSVALLISRNQLLKDLTAFFEQPDWQPDLLLGILRKYEASPEMFLHRLSNLLPRYFGIDNFFFLRFNDNLLLEKDNFSITKELHLSRLHNPHRNDLNEHYCRRWVSIRILEQMKTRQLAGDPPEILLEVQRSRFAGTKNEYLNFSLARPNTPSPHANVSVTLGIQVDNISRKKIRFIDSARIPVREVSETCERCSLRDCQERIAPPRVIESRTAAMALTRRLKELGDR